MAIRGTGRHRGLRVLSPDSIGKAADETATQITRIGLTFLGTSAFCLLSLLSPDSALLGAGSEKTNVINVPFAGPVSFFGFMLLGPAVLIVLRVYLQIYVEHSERLERLARSMSIARAPSLAPFHNPLIRYFSGLIFYLLLPLTMLLFALKAAVFPAWGSGLLGVAAAVIASHLILPLKKFSWREKAILSTVATIVMFAMIVGSGPVRRPFALFRANLSGQLLVGADLRGADLSEANLSGTNLSEANLSGANLIRANLTGANLTVTDLTGARLGGANLSRADLFRAKLIEANLSGADLSGANLTAAKLNGAGLRRANLNRASLVLVDLSDADLSDAHLSGTNLKAAYLTQEQLNQACGNSDTEPPLGLTLECSWDTVPAPFHSRP
ncbi:pentapeptide repeat-containing protein [Bradyrhizobium barranii subsp. apii]|uniref:pentapeptide repeat-containing protein n=1 Tax=Bradyrhizobium barranii TaxID=2992140 RepID=UPI001AA1AE03|nr:pentapeptide repeat-containing protein [Bradyrhizobium barranii]UPT96669.1 pentapeptide repeat-containing protein [Bradyrhizobium barranii subsp. apii]